MTEAAAAAAEEPSFLVFTCTHTHKDQALRVVIYPTGGIIVIIWAVAV